MATRRVPGSPIDNPNRASLRLPGLIAAGVGVLGSTALTLLVGRNNGSLLLMSMVVIWVGLPYLAQGLVAARAPRWPVRQQQMLYMMMLILATASLLLYGWVAFGPYTARPAFMFVIVPRISWVYFGWVLLSVSLAGKRPPR